ncbi:MAG: pyridoxal phosphate-dependent aminotransferase [Nitrososphaerales archaeon]
MFLDKLQDSPSLEMINLVLEMKTKGKEVISLAPGDPSFGTPKEIVEVAHRSMLDGGTHYVHSYGTLDVRNAIVKKVKRKNGIAAALESAIFITAKLAVFASLASVSAGSYEALVPDPGYFYSEPVILTGGRPVRYRLSASFGLDLDEIKKKTGPKTRAIVINTPSNPTGTVFGRSELRELYDFCYDRGVFILSDEAYEDLVYSKEHVSIGSLEKRPERVLSLYTLSKSYSMPGWRAGYIVGPEDRVALVNKLLEHTVTCFPPFIMHASAYALDNGDRFIRQFKKEYVKRRKLLNDRMAEIPALKAGEIEGSFYAFPGYTHRLNSRDLSRRLLQERNVAVLPGTAFGPSGEKHLRLCFAAPEETISRAMDGMKAFFGSSG